MVTSVNPGRWLELCGSFKLMPSIACGVRVFDVESGKEVTLADLLRRFSYDPSETQIRTGQVRLTIEPVP
jgi:hypothetical protein